MVFDALNKNMLHQNSDTAYFCDFTKGGYASASGVTLI